MVLAENLSYTGNNVSRTGITKLSYLRQWELAQIPIPGLLPKHIAQCLPSIFRTDLPGETPNFVSGGKDESLAYLRKLMREDIRIGKLAEIAKKGNISDASIPNEHGPERKGIVILGTNGEVAFIDGHTGTFHIFTDISLKIVYRKEGLPTRRCALEQDRQYHELLVQK